MDVPAADCGRDAAEAIRSAGGIAYAGTRCIVDHLAIRIGDRDCGTGRKAREAGRRGGAIVFERHRCGQRCHQIRGVDLAGTDAGTALIAGCLAGDDRRSRRYLGRIGYRHCQITRAGARRLYQERVADLRCAAGSLQRDAIESHWQTCIAAQHFVVGQTRHRILRTAGDVDDIYPVIAGSQLAGVAERWRDHQVAGIAGVGNDCRAGLRKEILAGGAVQVNTQIVLGIEGIGQADRHPSQGVLGITQGFVTKLHQTAERAAADDIVLQFHRDASGIYQGHRSTARIGSRGNRLQGGSLVTQNQGLPAADKHIVLTAILHHHLGRHQLPQAVHQAVALVQQVVRRLAAGSIAEQGDLLVDAGDLGGVRIDLVDRTGNLIVDVAIQAGQHLAHGAELVRQSLA